jgi:hypothetical protein
MPGVQRTCSKHAEALVGLVRLHCQCVAGCAALLKAVLHNNKPAAKQTAPGTHRSTCSHGPSQDSHLSAQCGQELLASRPATTHRSSTHTSCAQGRAATMQVVELPQHTCLLLAQALCAAQGSPGPTGT